MSLTLQPQAYLNELLAPTQEVESIPDDMQKKEDTQSCTLLFVDDNKDLTDYLSSAVSRITGIWLIARSSLICLHNSYPFMRGI